MNIKFQKMICLTLAAIACGFGQLTSYEDYFEDGIPTGWAIEEGQLTYTLTEADGVLNIDYEWITGSWVWDNFNFTPPENMDLSGMPRIKVSVKSDVYTEMVLKAVYANDTEDWLPVNLPGTNQWYEYSFDLLYAGGTELEKIYFYLDGGLETPYSAQVQFDNFRVGDAAGTPFEEPLILAVSHAWSLYYGTDEGTEEGEYAPGSKAELLEAVSEAETLLNDGLTDDEELVEAVWNLYDSCTEYETKVNVINIEPVDSLATRNTKYLYSNLELISAGHIMFGMQDPTGYGVGWEEDDDRSDVFDVCGDYPAVSSWATRHITLDEDIARDRYRMLSSYSRGGINTMAWHQIDPEGNGFYAEDVGYQNVVVTILPGGQHHELYQEKLRRLAAYLKSLRGSDGHTVPVIFRPYHEHDGSWFWWGAGQCTPEQYIELWQFTVHYLRDTLNVHSLLYAISPNNFQSENSYFDIYPGDDYVDILGMDHYFSSTIDDADRTEFQEKLQVISLAAQNRNKVASLTEVGQETVPTTDFWTRILLDPLKLDPLSRDVAYAAVWRNASETHHYAPYPGHPSVPDFLNFHADPFTLFESDLDAYSLDPAWHSPPELLDFPESELTVYDTVFEFSVYTNKRASLRFSSENVPYADMEFEFQEGQGGLYHTAEIFGQHGVLNTVYVAASDNTGNISDSEALQVWMDISQVQADWNDPGFSADDWQTGQTPLGYGNGDDITETAEVNTVYLRHAFAVEDLGAVPYLSVFVHLHDGAVLYLNGVEVARVNMNSLGEIEYDSHAENDDETHMRINLPNESVELLNPGINVFSVELHAAETEDPDISFDMELFYGIFLYLIEMGSEWQFSDTGQEPEDQIVDLAADDHIPKAPSKFALGSAYPNPFNSAVIIPYQVAEPERVRITVHNLLGQPVCGLADEIRFPGSYQIVWTGLNSEGIPVPSGIYLVQMYAGGMVLSQKAVLLK